MLVQVRRFDHDFHYNSMGRFGVALRICAERLVFATMLPGHRDTGGRMRKMAIVSIYCRCLVFLSMTDIPQPRGYSCISTPPSPHGRATIAEEQTSRLSSALLDLRW